MTPRPPIAWKHELRYSLCRAFYYGLATFALYLLSFVLLAFNVLDLLPGRGPLVSGAVVAVGALALPFLTLWYLFAAFVSATHLIGNSKNR